MSKFNKINYQLKNSKTILQKKILGNMNEEEVEKINKDLRKPKTQRGKRILEKRKPMVEEGPKNPPLVLQEKRVDLRARACVSRRV